MIRGDLSADIEEVLNIRVMTVCCFLQGSFFLISAFLSRKRMF